MIKLMINKVRFALRVKHKYLINIGEEDDYRVATIEKVRLIRYAHLYPVYKTVYRWSFFSDGDIINYKIIEEPKHIWVYELNSLFHVLKIAFMFDRVFKDNFKRSKNVLKQIIK